jgi:protein tyrosine phosphatase (PTP) superfamily phosphohydrolase (DUF442 family)
MSENSEHSVESIYNFLALSDALGTAGQPTQEQFLAIQKAGYQIVINLALTDSPNALPQEKELVESQGMEYVHIPVVWEQPEVEDALKFFRAMNTNSDKKIFVHCAANKRVSAFIYLYRTLHRGISQEEAKKDLHKLWIPNELWSSFIVRISVLPAGS